jgi:hypothetical protein
MKRHADGTWRNSNKPMVVSVEVQRARWVEAETLHLKKIGLSFQEIADQITSIGRGQGQPMTKIAEGITFPADYRISKQACHQAVKKAIAREPSLELEELRKIDDARCEDMWLNLQPGIRKGNARSIEVGVKVLGHRARISGLAAPEKHELTGKDGRPLTILQVLRVLGPIPD